MLSIDFIIKKTKTIKGVIIPITFVAISNEQEKEDKNAFLYENVSKKVIAK
jgi:hypothetical protein